MYFYHIQMHLPYGREDGTYLNPREMLNEPFPVIGTGEWDNIQCEQFKSAKIGSIVLVREGNTPIALVELVSENFQDDSLSQKFHHRNFRKVKILSWGDEKNYPRPGLFSQGTFKRSVNRESEQYLYINSWFIHTIKDKNMITLKDLLLNNYNLIFTGAPGTGKTYLAKQIAALIILGKEYDKETASNTEKEMMNEQCGFVQFHPSYDYTDFIEGLRPIDDGARNVSFRREDGIFMKFCRKALEAYNNAEDKGCAPKYVFIIDEINRGELSKIFGELFFSIDPGYRGENGQVKTQYCNLWKESDKFGGYETFFIPENVYIIGTMNDIDRSVESMDFAMRRRFAFKEIQASDTIDKMINSNSHLQESYPLIEARMTNLNLCILTIQGFSFAYQIGAAYFLKLANYLEEDKLTNKSWEDLWNNHLQGLLFEYLRGLPNADEELQKLHRAYLLEEKYKLEEGKVVKDE